MKKLALYLVAAGIALSLYCSRADQGYPEPDPRCVLAEHFVCDFE